MTDERRVRIAWLLGIPLAAFALQCLFAQFETGLITPDASVDLVAAVLGILMLVARLLAVLGVPLLVGWYLGLACFDYLAGPNDRRTRTRSET